MHRCLLSTSFSHNNVDRKQWQTFIADALHTIPSVMDISLNILGGRIHSEEASAPSFEQIGTAIQSIIDENVKYNDEVSSYTDNTSDCSTLSTEHQILMTWAWTNIVVGWS